MSFISGTWNFVKRHKGKFLLLGGAVGGVVYLNKVLNQVERDWAKSTSKDFVAEVRKKETHFENTIHTCNATCNNLSPKIVDILNELLDSEVILDKIKSDPVNKELWQKLVRTLFTRIISEVYCLSLLVCYLRVQLSVIAGYIYIDSLQTSSNGTSSVVNQSIQMKYLSLLNAFYQKGIQEIIEPVQEAVDNAVGNLSLTTKLSLSDLKGLVFKVKQSMAFSLSGENSHVSRYLIKAEEIEQLSSQLETNDDDDEVTLPSTRLFPQDIAILRKMMTETQDVLETDDFRKVLDASIDIGIDLVMDSMVTCFIKPDKELPSESGFVNPNTEKVPLAKLLPLMKLVLDKRITQDGDQLNLVRHLLCLDILNCFSANIYEGFCQPAK
ncbi:Peroxisomal biogenesis factor 3 [Halotydeus destructor]|nr:Peroxisomal biogenesis factor 3 [Halotydeus destructor]